MRNLGTCAIRMHARERNAGAATSERQRHRSQVMMRLSNRWEVITPQRHRWQVSAVSKAISVMSLEGFVRQWHFAELKRRTLATSAMRKRAMERNAAAATRTAIGQQSMERKAAAAPKSNAPAASDDDSKQPVGSDDDTSAPTRDDD